jgi:1,4-dihydroxy-2-naphthoate octaprenyltransferase
MCYVVAKKLVSKVTNYIYSMSKKNLGYVVFGKVDVGNSFGVTCFWKVEVDFGLWSWVLG